MSTLHQPIPEPAGFARAGKPNAVRREPPESTSTRAAQPDDPAGLHRNGRPNVRRTEGETP